MNYVDPNGLSGILPNGKYYITCPFDLELLQLKQMYEIASPQERKEIAEKAASIRNSGTPDVDWSVSASKPLQFYMIEDCTDRLNSLFVEVENLYGENKGLLDIPLFISIVKNNAEYDLKRKPEWQRRHFIYEGRILDIDEPGNILYGYLGKVFGYSDTLLKMGGGIYSIYDKITNGKFKEINWDWVFTNWGDDPRDTESMLFGAYIYSLGHKK